MSAKGKVAGQAIEHKPTGKRYWLEKRESWGKIQYSFDGGDTWHATKTKAFAEAESAGKLLTVTSRNPGRHHLPGASAHTNRVYEAILRSEKARGVPIQDAKRIAAATARSRAKNPLNYKPYHVHGFNKVKGQWEDLGTINELSKDRAIQQAKLRLKSRKYQFSKFIVGAQRMNPKKSKPRGTRGKKGQSTKRRNAKALPHDMQVAVDRLRPVPGLPADLRGSLAQLKKTIPKTPPGGLRDAMVKVKAQIEAALASQRKKNPPKKKNLSLFTTRKRAAAKAAKLKSKAKKLEAYAKRPTVRQRVKAKVARKAHGVVSRILGNPKGIRWVGKVTEDSSMFAGNDNFVINRITGGRNDGKYQLYEGNNKYTLHSTVRAAQQRAERIHRKSAKYHRLGKKLTRDTRKQSNSKRTVKGKRRNKTIIKAKRVVIASANPRRGSRKLLGLNKRVLDAWEKSQTSATPEQRRRWAKVYVRLADERDVERAKLRSKSNPKRGRKRNGPAEQARMQRQSFAGKTKGIKQIFMPEGTPKDGLSTLGPLKLLVMSDGRKYKAAPGVWAVRDLHGKVYFGTTKQGGVIWNGPAEDIGPVKRIEYGPMSKIHIGEKRPAIFYHDFSNPKPHLKADGKGGASLTKGNFSIGAEGISG